MSWYFLRSTLEKQLVTSGGEEGGQGSAVLVFVDNGYIVAALDERVQPREVWEAVAEWGSGLEVPLSSAWKSKAFGLVRPLEGS